jgi:superfamily II RNA helicase
MNCNEARENLIEMVGENLADPSLTAHVRQCDACAQELESLRKTMNLLDEWEAPEPSPYFLTRLRAHVKEEREKAPARLSIFSWMRRPAMAVSLATVLVAGGAVYTVLRSVEPPPQQEGTAVADVEALDRNHDVLVNTDIIDEMSGGPSDDVSDVTDGTDSIIE